MAGTVTLYSDRVYEGGREVVFSCVGDASDGTLPDTNLVDIDDLVYGPISGWGLWLIETYPGATAPTDATDLYLKSAAGADFLDGAGVDGIDATAAVLITPPNGMLIVGGTLSMVVDNQSVNSATFSVKLYLVR